MKYKTKVAPFENGYIGYVMVNEEVVFTTNVQRDTIMVAREISSYIAGKTQPAALPEAVPIRRYSPTPPPVNDVPLKRRSDSPSSTSPSVVLDPQTGANPTLPPRRCCGRG